MKFDRLKDLSDTGIGYANDAYNKADIGSAEESLALSLRTLFEIYKELAEDDDGDDLITIK